MFYLALVNNKNEIKYPVHYEKEKDREMRLMGYEIQALGEPGEWGVYLGNEPFECYLIRRDVKQQDSESKDDFDVRMGLAIQEAFNKSSSKIEAPMIDDEPIWHKKGYLTLEEYEAHNPKA